MSNSVFARSTVSAVFLAGSFWCFPLVMSGQVAAASPSDGAAAAAAAHAGAASSAAVPPEAGAETATKPYSEEPAVVEYVESVVYAASDGTGWKEHRAVIRIQAEAALKQYGVITIPYASKSEKAEIEYVRVRHADGTVVSTDTTDALEVPTAVTRAAPFYSDQRELQLPVRSLRVGDTLEYKARVTRSTSLVPGQFWGAITFAENTVVLKQTLELRVPARMSVNVWSKSVKPEESMTAATGTSPATPELHVYKWISKQLKPTVGKEAEAEIAAKKKIPWTAEQELDAEKGKLPSVAWTTFKSWEEVGAWYRGLEADRIVPDETVRTKAAELTAGKTTDEEKAQALYNYVATNIRYIGVALGIGRYRPHTAAEILANQYGDCKDKHTLLAAMLESVGLHADAVLIGAGIRLNEAVPSPAAFNHMITRLTLPAKEGKPDQTVWLDTTSEVAPWRLLSPTIRDKQALVVISATAGGTSAPAYLARTLEATPFPDLVKVESVGTLDADGVVSTHMLLTARGDAEVVLRAILRRLPAGKYQAFVQAFVKSLGFAGSVTNPQISSPEATEKPFTISFDYKAEKLGDWEHLRTPAQLAPVILPRVAGVDPPNHDIQLGRPRIQLSHSELKMPEGWTAVVPQPIHLKCAYGTYDLTYKVENGTVYADRALQILVKKVPLSGWKEYMEWSNAIHPGQEWYVRLVKHAPPA